MPFVKHHYGSWRSIIVCKLRRRLYLKDRIRHYQERINICGQELEQVEKDIILLEQKAEGNKKPS